MAFSTPEKASEYNRQYYLKHKDRLRAGMAQWREKNRDRHLAKAREYSLENRERLLQQKRERRKSNPRYFNDQKRQSKFGLKPEQYQAMLESQDYCCALCGDKRQLVVDHDHKTKVVRELLCAPCNTTLGLMKEDTKRLWRAIEYVVAHRKQAPQGVVPA